MGHAHIQRDVASAAAWLDLADVQELLRLMLGDAWDAAQGVLDRIVPDLADACDLHDPVWREAWFDELEYRLAPADTEDDPDAVATREIPDYARFARTG